MTDGNIISLTDPEVQKCPFHAYAKLRKDAPVYKDPVTGAFVITRYDLVRKATLDTDSFSSRAGQISVRDSSAAAEVHRIYEERGWQPVLTLVNNDPPDHTRFRALVDKAFTAPKVRALEPYIESVVDELIDAFINDGQTEFMASFGHVLPLIVFCHELGIPREELEQFKHWSDVLLEQMNPLLETERELELTHEVCDLEQYLVQKAEGYKKNPGSNILSDLVHAEVDGEHLNTSELLSVIMQLVPAGHETTANAIGTGMLSLARNPDMAEQLRRDPSLMKVFVEEVLRIDAPVQGLWRRATKDIELAGVQIPEGSTLVLSWGAANRDPEQFPDPDRIDLSRQNARQHQSFGVGAHFCVGNALSRAEMRISFTRCLARMTNIRLSKGEESVDYQPHFFAHGPAELHLRFDKSQ